MKDPEAAIPVPHGRHEHQSYRIAHRGPVFHFFWPYTRYVITHIAVCISVFFFEVMNRTVVIGRDNVGEDPNTLLLPNHQSMIDGFLVGYAVFFPRSLVKPMLLPWLPAAAENFFGNPVMRYLSDNFKCIPVKPGRKDFGVIHRMEACLRTGVMIVFPEGTRTRDGRLLPPRSGIGYVMLRTGAKAIPVCMDGMDGVLPVGQALPNIFRTVLVYYGKPVDLSEFAGLPPSEAAQPAIEKVFAEVRRLKRILERYRRYRRYLLEFRPFWAKFYRN